MDVIDPAFILTARCLLAFVFALALIHKFRSPQAFVATVENYRLLPAAVARLVGWVLIVLELLALGGLVAGMRAGALLTAGLLGVYTGAIAINLLRGRRDIDCGCSGPAMRQTLNGWLVGRNAGLVVLSLFVLAPVGARPLTLLDAFTTLAAVLTFALIYTSTNQLAVTVSRFTRSE